LCDKRRCFPIANGRPIEIVLTWASKSVENPGSFCIIRLSSDGMSPTNSITAVSYDLSASSTHYVGNAPEEPRLELAAQVDGLMSGDEAD
jgi:hypothetical protein